MSVSGSGQPSVMSDVRSREQRADRVVVDVDQRDPHARPDAELVEQRSGVDALHPGIVPRMLLVYGPRSGSYDFGPGHPLTPSSVRPGPGPPADRSAPSPGWRPNRHPTTSSRLCHTRALHRRREAILGGADRASTARPGSARVATIHRSPGCTRRARWSRAARSARWRRSCAATSSTPSTRAAVSTTRCRAARRGSASTTTRRWRSPGPGAMACACCTSISTSTTATASRRSTGTIRAC